MTTSFPKQILTPSRFKLILLINNGIDWKDHNSCSFWAENFGRSLEGQGGPTRGSKVFNTIIQMEAGYLRENPQTPQQQETLQAITYKAAKGWCAFFYSSKQSSHQTKRNNKKLPSTGFKQQPICTPLAPTRTKSSTKQLPPTGPILGPENILKTGFAQKGLPSKGGLKGGLKGGGLKA